MPRLLNRIVSVLLISSLLATTANASALSLSETHVVHNAVDGIFTAQALNAPGNVFLHPRTFTARAGVVVVTLAVGALIFYGAIKYPRPAFLLFNTTVLIFGAVFGTGGSQGSMPPEDIGALMKNVRDASEAEEMTHELALASARAADALAEKGSAAIPAIPVLLKASHDARYDDFGSPTRQHFIAALIEIGPANHEVEKEFAKLLQNDSNEYARSGAARALSSGLQIPYSSKTIAALIKGAEEKNPYVANPCRIALQKSPVAYVNAMLRKYPNGFIPEGPDKVLDKYLIDKSPEVWFLWFMVHVSALLLDKKDIGQYSTGWLHQDFWLNRYGTPEKAGHRQSLDEYLRDLRVEGTTGQILQLVSNRMSVRFPVKKQEPHKLEIIDLTRTDVHRIPVFPLRNNRGESFQDVRVRAFTDYPARRSRIIKFWDAGNGNVIEEPMETFLDRAHNRDQFPLSDPGFKAYAERIASMSNEQLEVEAQPILEASGDLVLKAKAAGRASPMIIELLDVMSEEEGFQGFDHHIITAFAGEILLRQRLQRRSTDKLQDILAAAGHRQAILYEILFRWSLPDSVQLPKTPLELPAQLPPNTSSGNEDSSEHSALRAAA